jgi:hypothetical protein
MTKTYIENFQDYDGIHHYFTKDLPGRKGEYLFRSRGPRAPDGSTMLFQWSATIVAQASVIEVVHKPVNWTYAGFLRIALDTLVLFRAPVTQRELGSVWPGKVLGNAWHNLDVSSFGAWQVLTSGRSVPWNKA